VASQAVRSNAAATHATKWSQAMTAPATTTTTTTAPKTTNFAQEGAFKSDLFQKVSAECYFPALGMGESS
jgi:hypothetical protein